MQFGFVGWIDQSLDGLWGAGCRRTKRLRHCDRSRKAAEVSAPLPGDVERRSVVGARPHEGQPDRRIDAGVQSEILDWDQAMVMRHGDDHVELAKASSAHKNGIRRPGAAGIQAQGARLANRGLDLVDFFTSEQTALARDR